MHYYVEFFSSGAFQGWGLGSESLVTQGMKVGLKNESRAATRR